MILTFCLSNFNLHYMYVCVHTYFKLLVFHVSKGEICTEQLENSTMQLTCLKMVK